MSEHIDTEVKEITDDSTSESSEFTLGSSESSEELLSDKSTSYFLGGVQEWTSKRI